MKFVTRDNSQRHKLSSDQWEPAIILCARLEMYAKRNFQYFTIQFCHFPTYYPSQICIDIVEIHSYHFASPHFCSDKPRTAHGIREKGGEMWMWLTISCKWYGWVIALRCMALIYLPSHFNTPKFSHKVLIQHCWWPIDQLCTQPTNRPVL